MKKSIRTRLLLPIGSAALGAGAVLAVTFVPAGVVDAAEAPPSPESVLGLLSDAQQKDDRLPSAISLDGIGQGGLDESTARLAGRSAQGRVWVGADRGGDVCLIVELGVSGGSGSACAPTDVFAERGLSLAVTGPQGAYVEAYLTADGTSVTKVPTGLSEAGRGLLVGDTRRAASASIGLRLDSGASAGIPLVHPSE